VLLCAQLKKSSGKEITETLATENTARGTGASRNEQNGEERRKGNTAWSFNSKINH
jgi:hypothetical protein